MSLIAGAMFAACLVGADGFAIGPCPLGAMRAATSSVDQSESPSASLQAILGDWSRNSATIESLHGSFHYWNYHGAFQTCEQSAGSFWYSADGKKRIDFHGADQRPGSTLTIQGEIWKQVAATQSRWIADGRRLLQILPAKSSYELVPIDAGSERMSDWFRPSRFAELILPPFLSGLKPDQVSRYDFRTGPLHGRQVKVGPVPQRVHHVIASPKEESERTYWQRVEILLDPDTLLPLSIKIVDPASGPRNRQEQVFVLRNVKLNQPFACAEGDPFNPSLTGLLQTSIQQPPANTVEQDLPAAPPEQSAGSASFDKALCWALLPIVHGCLCVVCTAIGI